MSHAISICLAGNPAGIPLAMVLGSLLAVSCWHGSHLFARLWNRRFRARPVHQILSAFAVLFTLATALVYPSLAYIRQAGEASIAEWQSDIRADEAWAESTFRTAFGAVRNLGVEDFSGIANPGSPGSLIPTSHDRSRQTAANVYASAACGHFARSRPFLSMVVWASPGIPADVLFADVRRWQERDPTYPPERAIALAVEQIQNGLIGQTPRLVTASRVLLIFLFLAMQAIAFGLIGWAAYSDIKVRT